MSKKAILVIVLLAASLAGTALAGVNVNINIGVPLPEVVVAAPPALAVIPGTYVYIATDVNADLVFYQDNWYRPHGGGWFVSLSYNGPWKTVAAPPAALTRLPQNYHSVPPGYERMPYGQVRENWRAWERDRYWDRVADRNDDDRDHGNGHHHKKHKKKKHHDDDDDDDDYHDGGRGRHEHDR
jgi:hypothetical protein